MARKPMRADPNDLSEYIAEVFVPQIEKEHDIDILLAVESGSRMWGFASADSDYDIRFIYRHRNIFHNFGVGTPYDTIEQKDANPLIDASGWDVTKAIRLMTSGNGTLLDWLGSHIVYKKNPDAFALMVLLQSHLMGIDRIRMKVMMHHRSLATSAYHQARESTVAGEVSGKKILYALRSSVIAMRLADDFERSGGNRSVPLTMKGIIPILPIDLGEEIGRLVRQKTNAPCEKKFSVDIVQFPLIEQLIRDVAVYKPVVKTDDVVDPVFGTAILRSLIALK